MLLQHDIHDRSEAMYIESKLGTEFTSKSSWAARVVTEESECVSKADLLNWIWYQDIPIRKLLCLTVFGDRNFPALTSF